MSVKSESESECESFDSESSSDDEEFTSGQINEENDNASAFDQLMAHSEEQVNIDTQMVDFVSLPSTSTGRSRRRRHRSTRAKKNNANFTVTLIEDSFARKRVNSVRTVPVVDVVTLNVHSFCSRFRSERTNQCLSSLKTRRAAMTRNLLANQAPQSARFLHL